MARSKVPSWDEIRSLIAKADQLCRESEFVRAHAERIMRRPTIWPDRRQPARKHDRVDPAGARDADRNDKDDDDCAS